VLLRLDHALQFDIDCQAVTNDAHFRHLRDGAADTRW
jgi:hypothetical protein